MSAVPLAALVGAPPRPFVARSSTPAVGGSASALSGAKAAALPLLSGLVDNSTSDTPLNCVSAFDRDVMRLRRMKRRITKASEVHTDSDQYGLRPAMVTLTYREVFDWQPRHLSAALKCVRQWLARRGCRFRYCWVAELQARGAVHYHILAWLPYGEHKPPFWDAQGWWSHGSSQSAWAVNPVGYITKYATKVGSKDRLPWGARMHGSGGFTKAERQQMSHHSRPAWLRQLTSAMQTVRRNVVGKFPAAPRGGWIQHFACGLARHIASPFELIGGAGGQTVFIVRKGAPREQTLTEYRDLWQAQYLPA